MKYTVAQSNFQPTTVTAVPEFKSPILPKIIAGFRKAWAQLNARVDDYLIEHVIKPAVDESRKNQPNTAHEVGEAVGRAIDEIIASHRNDPARKNPAHRPQGTSTLKVFSKGPHRRKGQIKTSRKRHPSTLMT